MSKKLTLKKGLAFGTALAFGSTLIAAAPAMAAPSLSLVPAYGSGYSSLNGYYNDDFDASQIFVFKSNFVDEPMGKNVIYKVENPGEAWLVYEVDEDEYTAAGEVWDYYAEDYDGETDNDVFYIDEAPDTDLTSYLAINTTTEDADVTIKVTAFYDVNENGELDSEEGAADVASATRTLTWYSPANSKPVATLQQPAWGDDFLLTTVSFGVTGMNTQMLYEVNDLVEDYMSEDYEQQVYVETEDRPAGDTWGGLDDNEAYWNSDDSVYESEDSLGGDVVVGRYRAQVGVYDYDLEETEWSAWSYVSVSEPKADYVEVDAVTGANVTDNPDSGDTDYGIRTGTKSVAFEAVAFDSDDDEVSGVPVTITIGDDGLESGSSVTAGGKTLKNTGDNEIEFTVTTNASGVAAFTLTSSKAVESDEIYVTAEVDDVDGGIYSDTLEATWEDAVVDEFVETSPIDYDYNTSRSILKGGSFTLNYLVLDQFNEPTSTEDGDDLRVVLTDDGADYDITSSKSVGSNGQVSFTITDDSDDIVASYDVDANLYADYGTSLSASIDSWTSVIFVNEKASASEFFDINVWGEGDGSDSTGDLTAAELADKDNYDVTEVYGDVTYEDFSTGKHWEDVDFGTLTDDGDYIDFGLYVADSNGDIQPGATVSVSAPGLLIQDYEYEDQASVGSYSAPADDEGWFEINLFSHKSGVFPVTVTSGSAKITFNVAFYVDSSDVAADEAKLTFSKTATWGKGSIDVKASVVDKWGNGIEGETVEFSKAGLGFLDEVSADTDASGIARVTLVGGTAGSTKVTAESDDSFDAMSASTTLRWWNKTASASEGVKAGRVLVYGIASAGDRVVVRVDGKKVAAYTASGRFSYVVKGVGSGTKDVVVRINKKKVFSDILLVN